MEGAPRRGVPQPLVGCDFPQAGRGSLSSAREATPLELAIGGRNVGNEVEPSDGRHGLLLPNRLRREDGRALSWSSIGSRELPPLPFRSTAPVHGLVRSP